ncbi:tetratricopeptide (TPR) repeat protein [Bradyrhizobium sp. URHC0002]
MHCRNALVVAWVLGAMSSASAVECTMGQVAIDSASVITPCGELLAANNLSDRDRAQAYFVRGRGYHRTQRLNEAAEDYRAAFALDPKNEEILVSWSNVDVRLRRMGDYKRRVEQAYALNPQNPRVLRAVGMLLHNMGELDKAFEFYSKAIEVDPTESFALYMRMREYRFRRNFAEAIADASALLAIPPARLNDGQGFLDSDGIIRDFRVVALLERAYSYQDSGRLDLAEKDYDAAVDAGHSAPALVARAHFLGFYAQRQDDALRDLTEAVHKESRNYKALHALGISLAGFKRFEEAFAAFDAAVTVRPDYATGLIMRARMHRQFGRTDAAVRDLKTAVSLDRSELDELMNALRHAGYWSEPGLPSGQTRELDDAMRACMIDPQC